MATAPPAAATASSMATPAAGATANTVPLADSAALFRAFAETINRGDPAAARGLFTPDATWELGGQCPPSQCSDLARLGVEIDRDITNHHRLDVLALDSAGRTATARVELRNDGTRAAGVERTIQTFTVTHPGREDRLAARGERPQRPADGHIRRAPARYWRPPRGPTSVQGQPMVRWTFEPQPHISKARQSW